MTTFSPRSTGRTLGATCLTSQQSLTAANRSSGVGTDSPSRCDCVVCRAGRREVEPPGARNPACRAEWDAGTGIDDLQGEFTHKSA